MLSDELLTLFRSEMNDTTQDYLWTDADGYSYIDDAQKMFCRLTDGISDGTTGAVVDITATAGATWLPLHASILKIRGASRTSDGCELEILNYEDMPARGLRFDTRTGPLQTLIVGMEENKVRAYPIVSITDAIKLLVFRLPLVDITTSGQTLEVASQHLQHLLLWAKHRAYLKQDAETFNKSKAVEFEEKFRAYCAAAKVEQGNKRHKVRKVAYGGI